MIRLVIRSVCQACYQLRFVRRGRIGGLRYLSHSLYHPFSLSHSKKQKGFLILITAYYLVSWSEFVAKQPNIVFVGDSSCYIAEEIKERQFESEDEARQFIEQEKVDRKKTNFKLLEVREIR